MLLLSNGYGAATFSIRLRIDIHATQFMFGYIPVTSYNLLTIAPCGWEFNRQ